MPWDNVWIDALLWGGTVLLGTAVVLWWEARKNPRHPEPQETIRHVRVLGPAGLDHNGRVQKVGTDRHAPACHDGYCPCGLADLDGEVVA